MILNVYAIKDRYVGFSTPFTFENDKVALRAFENSVNSEVANACNTYPEDKELCRLAKFDTNTGLFEIDYEMLSGATAFIRKGGQDVQKEELFNDLYQLSTEDKIDDNLPKV